MAEKGNAYYDQNQQEYKYVQLQREPDKPLGATIKKEGSRLVVARIVRGSQCDGHFNEGDVLIAVNGTSLEGLELNDAFDALLKMNGNMTFYVLPSPSGQRKPTRQTQNLCLKALFAYNPLNDYLNPCKELGLTFEPGDFIHVVCQDDPDWWQGYKAGADEGLNRIFPSPEFQRRTVKEGLKDRVFYEPQGRLHPPLQRRRPLVLVAPPCSGCHELRVHLIESDPDRFASPVTYTTRRARAGEENELDYWFVDSGEFKQLRRQGAFLETSKYGSDLYGTTISGIQKVLDSGKVCVVSLQPCNLPTCSAAACCLQTLRTHHFRLMPYFVFLSPDQLRNWLASLAAKQPNRQAYTFEPTELNSIEEIGRRMLTSHRHIIDTVLHPEDPDAALEKLVELTSRIEQEPQWVPESWL